MRLIPLAQVPNQAFSARIGETRVVMQIKEARGVMVMDFDRDGVRLLSGTPILAGEALIPYRYLEDGNFVLLTISDELPDWRAFGSSQALVFLSRVEISEIPRVTIADVTPVPVASFLTTDEGDYILTDGGDLISEG